MALFGAYFTVEKKEAADEPNYGPLVTTGLKKYTEEEKKFEIAYLDVDEEVQMVQPVNQSSMREAQDKHQGNLENGVITTGVTRKSTSKPRL